MSFHNEMPVSDVMPWRCWRFCSRRGRRKPRPRAATRALATVQQQNALQQQQNAVQTAAQETTLLVQFANRRLAQVNPLDTIARLHATQCNESEPFPTTSHCLAECHSADDGFAASQLLAK